MAATYLIKHLEVLHNVHHTYVQEEEEICNPAPRSFVARAAPGVNKWHCPVPDCPMQEGAYPTALWWHFAFRHS